MLTQVCRYVLAVMLTTGLMASTAQCNPDHGARIGAHDGACLQPGEVQTRVDGTKWRCEKGDPGDYPYGTWVRIG